MKELEKITKQTYNSISQNWDEKRSYYWKPVVNFIENIQKKENLKFLDLGCGTGRHLELAQKKKFKKENIIGADYSKGQLKIVKEKGFKIIQTDLTNLKIKDKEFDIIVCIAAHHHILEKEKQLKSLEEMRRILKENGKILLSNWFPDKEFVEEQIKKGKFEFDKKNNQIVKVTYTHENKKYNRFYYLFKEEELIELCKKADFKIEKKEYDKGNLYLTMS